MQYARIAGAAADFAEIHVCVVLPETDANNDPIYESLGDHGADAVEQAKEAVDNGYARSWCYTVYWHLSAGGVQHVADFADRTKAEQLYAALMCAVAVQRGMARDAVAFASEALGMQR
jgi:hypothetical protein